MALRATSGPEAAPRSVTVGKPVTIRAKIENTGATPERVSCFAQLVEGALRRPMEFPFVAEPTVVEVAPKTRTVVEFRWIAALPEGKSAHTFRGTIGIRQTETGQLVGEAPLDLYVSAL